MQAWTVLTDYNRMLHQKAHLEYTRLIANEKQVPRREMVKEKLQVMTQLAELSCSSQAGLLRARAWESRLGLRIK
jgi:hypothetical protein